MRPSPPDPNDGPSSRELITLGLSLALAVIVPLAGGLLVDARFNTAPVGALAGVVLGIVAGSFTLYTRFKRYL